MYPFDPVLNQLINNYHNFGIAIFLLLFLNSVFILLIKRLEEKKLLAKENFYSPTLLFSKKEIFLMLILTTIFFSWKGFNISRECFDIMETANTGAGPFRFGLGDIPGLVQFAHQPLYPILLSAVSGLIIANNDYSLRLLSLVFSLSTAWLLCYFSFRIFKDKLISFLSFLLFNVFALSTFYSRRTEAYSLFCFLAILSYYYFWTTFISAEEKAIWKYCIVTIAAFFTHYVIFAVILSQVLTVTIIKVINKNYHYRSFINFLKSLFICNFVFIIFYPALYSSVINNKFVFMNPGLSYYLTPDTIFPFIDNFFRIILGLPLGRLYFYFPAIILILFSVIPFSKKKESKFFIIMFFCVILSFMLGEILFLSQLKRKTGGIYFNVRHFIWLVPFMAIAYSYPATLLKEKHLKFYSKILILLSLCFIFLSNSYLTNKIIFEPVNPDVKSALLYVKKNIRNGDLITYSCGWFTLVIEKNASGIFNSEEIRKSTCNILLEDFPGKDELERPYKLMTLEKILRQKETIKRIWVLFPWEDILGVDHLNIKSLNSDISLLKRNLGFVNVWNGNKISVYLFNVD